MKDVFIEKGERSWEAVFAFSVMKMRAIKVEAQLAAGVFWKKLRLLDSMSYCPTDGVDDYFSSDCSQKTWYINM